MSKQWTQQCCRQTSANPSDFFVVLIMIATARLSFLLLNQGSRLDIVCRVWFCVSVYLCFFCEFVDHLQKNFTKYNLLLVEYGIFNPAYRLNYCCTLEPVISVRHSVCTLLYSVNMFMYACLL